MSEFRKDPITGRWVIIASERAKRPRRLGAAAAQEQAEPCPFCAGNEALTPPEIWADREPDSRPDMPGWSVRVVPNKYPALAGDAVAGKNNDQLFQSLPALGAHEVVIECPDHVANLGSLDAPQLGKILSAYRERAQSLSRDSRWRYLLIFKNHGERAGATLDHLHSQLVALPDLPKQAADEIDGARAHFRAAGRCLYCMISERETQARERVVVDHPGFIAFCPFASRFAYETWILPKAHRESFAQSSEQEIFDLAHTLGETIRRLNGALDNPPFNFFIHSLPIGETPAGYYHWHLEILPQLTRAAGFEWGSGGFINAVAPEEAAKLLRDAAI